MPEEVTRLRIFMASPGDVLDERERLRLAVDELDRTLADSLGQSLQLLDWRDVVSSTGRPEQVILDQLELNAWDIFIGILWTRFGTPPGATHPETGEPFLSGTEEEFTLAYQAWKQTGRPQILFYRCLRPIPTSIDTVQLQQVQEFFKGFEASGTYPGLYRTYKTLEDFERHVRKDLTLLLLDYSKEQVLATRQPELARQIAELEAAEPEPPSPHIPFTNREDEIKQILSSFAPPYHLIDAPAGYGKTALLKELKRRFEEQRWTCAYVSVQEHKTVSDIAQALAAELDVSLTADVVDAKKLGLDLGGQIIQRREEDFARKGTEVCKGVVLFIDVDKKPWTSLLPTVDALFTDFIPGVEYCLHGSEFFRKEHNPLRVIFAGRYIAGKTPEATPISLTVHKLAPFNYEVIRDTAKTYLSDQRGVSQLAAHLMYYTCGHPGCMARVLELYEERKYPPDDFFRYSADEIWKDIVYPEANAVHNDIRRRLRRVFDDLSIFRYLDYSVLRRLLDEAAYPERESEFDLADELTSTYLMGWKGRLLRDDITRRLLAIRLLLEIGPQLFAKHCQRAQGIYAAHLQEPNAQVPERWAIEYLFQYLQQYTEAIQIRQKREEIRQSFFGETVPEALQLLVGVNGRNAQEEHKALKQTLEVDWEFRFTVNYFLRQDEYNDEPYRELQRRMDDSLSKMV
jgi:hypothetical protein